MSKNREFWVTDKMAKMLNEAIRRIPDKFDVLPRIWVGTPPSPPAPLPLPIHYLREEFFGLKKEKKKKIMAID